MLFMLIFVNATCHENDLLSVVAMCPSVVGVQTGVHTETYSVYRKHTGQEVSQQLPTGTKRFSFLVICYNLNIFGSTQACFTK